MIGGAWTSSLTSTTSTGLSLSVSDVTGKRTKLKPRVAENPQLSGTRLVYMGVDSHVGTAYLYNVVTGATVDLTKKYKISDGSTPALAGDYLAFPRSDGSVWRANIATGSAPVNVLAAKAKTNYATVFAYGDYVAWSRYDNNDRVTNGFRNAYTRAKAVALTSRQIPVGASTGGVVLRDSNTTKASVRSWTSSTVVKLPAMDDQATPTVHGAVVGYVGTDGKPRVQLLTAKLAARPRALGNATHTATVRTKQSWSLGLVASAAPTSCSVTFRNAKKKVVTTVGCSSAYLKYGEIRATWNGTVKGKRVPLGKYSWTVNAKNADGTLVNESGSAAATSGSLTIAK